MKSYQMDQKFVTKASNFPEKKEIKNKQTQMNKEKIESISFKIFTYEKTKCPLQMLIQLKQLYSSRLPKMPKQHILNIILNQNYTHLIMINNNKKIIGATSFRLFHQNKLNQIVFFAISSLYQRKGNGSKLMYVLKSHMQKIGIKHLLTYADDLAHGFFYCQGFSQNIKLPKQQYDGLIQAYQGGTLMHCTIEKISTSIQLQKNIKEK